MVVVEGGGGGAKMQAEREQGDRKAPKEVVGREGMLSLWLWSCREMTRVCVEMRKDLLF